MGLKALDLYCCREEARSPAASASSRWKPYYPTTPPYLSLSCPFSLCPTAPWVLGASHLISLPGGCNPCLPTEFQTSTIYQSSKYIPRPIGSWSTIPAFQLPPGLLVPAGFTGISNAVCPGDHFPHEPVPLSYNPFPTCTG